jgi:pantoate--beta-alanine ligase
MQIHTTIDSMRRASQALRQPPRTLALVPTLGALHDGHLSLVRAARASSDHVAASIFVNPTQFAPNEDFDLYPRTFDADCALLTREGVDLLFAPSTEEMYPQNSATWVDVPAIAGRLDGASRPGHFRGVATVVAKLFHIVQPHRAFFGQKDAAQLAVLRALVRDLNFDLEIIACPTIREPSGLALSSRNRFLTPQQHDQALALHRALLHARQAAPNATPETLRDLLHHDLSAAPGLRLDYAEVVDPDTLEPLSTLTSGALLAVAAWLGPTRLIDNLLLPPTPLPLLAPPTSHLLPGSNPALFPAAHKSSPLPSLAPPTSHLLPGPNPALLPPSPTPSGGDHEDPPPTGAPQ